MFAQVTTDQVIQGFGLPAAIVIVSLVVALIFTVRLLLKAYDKISGIQETRIAEAKDFGNKIAEPLESIRNMAVSQSTLQEKMYEILRDTKRGN